MLLNIGLSLDQPQAQLCLANGLISGGHDSMARLALRVENVELLVYMTIDACSVDRQGGEL